jgi:hypothetical protein
MASRVGPTVAPWLMNTHSGGDAPTASDLARAASARHQHVRAGLAAGLSVLAAARAAYEVSVVMMGGGLGWSAPMESAAACVALAALAAAVRWADPVVVARLAGPIVMAVVGTLPLVISGALVQGGFHDIDTEVQMRLFAVILVFPAVFRMTTGAFVVAAAIPLGTATAIACMELSFEGDTTSTIYFFVAVLLVFSFTAYAPLRNRRTTAEVHAMAARLELESKTLHSLLTRCARSRADARVFACSRVLCV